MIYRVGLKQNKLYLNLIKINYIIFGRRQKTNKNKTKTMTLK